MNNPSSALPPFWMMKLTEAWGEPKKLFQGRGRRVKNRAGGGEEKIQLHAVACSRLSDSRGEQKIGASEKKKNDGAGGRERSGRRACKTFFYSGPVLVYQLLVCPLIGQFWQFLATPAKRVTCVSHVNRENGSRARFRGIQVMWYFARMSPGFSRTKGLLLHVLNGYRTIRLVCFGGYNFPVDWINL